MTVALKIWILYLIPEFLAHAFILLGTFPPARAITSGQFKTFFYGIYYVFIRIEFYHITNRSCLLFRRD